MEADEQRQRDLALVAAQEQKRTDQLNRRRRRDIERHGAFHAERRRRWPGFALNAEVFPIWLPDTLVLAPHGARHGDETVLVDRLTGVVRCRLAGLFVIPHRSELHARSVGMELRVMNPTASLPARSTTGRTVWFVEVVDVARQPDDVDYEDVSPVVARLRGAAATADIEIRGIDLYGPDEPREWPAETVLATDAPDDVLARIGGLLILPEGARIETGLNPMWEGRVCSGSVLRSGSRPAGPMGGGVDWRIDIRTATRDGPLGDWGR